MKDISLRLRMPRLLGCASLLVLGAIPLPLSFFLCLFLGCSQNGSAVAPEDEDVATTRARLLSLPAPDPSVNLQFGTSVAADSQTLIIGDSQALATSTDNQQHNKGQVHIYARSGGIESWTPLQVLKPFGPVNGEVHFGEHLALHGNLLVVSADRDALDCPSYPCPNPADDSQQGAFYVFSRTAPGQSFTRVGTKFTEPSPVRENRFGLLVATNGRFIAATAGVTDGGNGFDVQVFTVQANGSVVRSYGIDPTLKPLAMTMTESGILAVIPSNGPGVIAYQLQATQAVPLANTSTLGTGYLDVVSNGNTIALLDSNNGGRVVLAPLTSAGPGAVTTIGPALGLGNPQSISLLENQRVLVGDQDLTRPKLAKYELVGGTWTNTGFIYPPLVSRMTETRFAMALASTSELVVAGQVQKVYLSSLETNARLDGATFEKQRILTSDACGTACQSFLGSELGRETAISGDVAAAVQVELAGTHDDSVHIFTRQAGVWTQTGQFSFPGKGARDVAVDSGRVYVGVGTPTPTVPGGFSDGAVLVYERDASNVWQNVATLIGSDAPSIPSTLVGDSIAASGNLVAAGSSGFVYLFQRGANGVWSPLPTLTVTPFAAPQGIAHALALSDTYLVVGARRDSTTKADQGSVFVYKRSDFSLDQKIIPQFSLNEGMQYGYSVAIDGTTILIGAPDGGEFQGGFVEVRDRTGTGATPWQFTTTLSIGISLGFDYRVGTTVSLVGNQALIGALGDPLTSGQGGAAYLIPRVSGTWDETKTHTLLNSDFGQSGARSFGWGVQMSGTSAVIGAPESTTPTGNGGTVYFFDGLVDADGDGLLATDDCNDNDGLAVSCVLGAANMSFEPPPQPAWTADAGSFTFSTTHTDGTSSLKLGTGPARLTGPLFSTTILHEVGSALALDIQRPTGGSNALTLFMSAPALNIVQSAIGTIDLSALPTGTWTAVSVPIPTALRNVLINQSTNVRFHLSFNASAPNLLIDHLRFTGTFASRPAPPPPGTVTATLTPTSSSSTSYCAALKLGNSGTLATTTWSVVIDMHGTTLANNWNAAFTGTGPVTIRNNQTWNASIPAGATAFDPSVGFCANRAAGSNAVATVVSATGQ